jgi:hypothetical protein
MEITRNHKKSRESRNQFVPPCSSLEKRIQNGKTFFEQKQGKKDD